VFPFDVFFVWLESELKIRDEFVVFDFKFPVV
jgi:hypothetical protein